MLTVASLSRRQLETRLAGPGLLVQTGAFVSRIRSPIRHVADGIALLYGDYPIHGADGFADFHVGLQYPGGLRRWYQPQVNFDLDGQLPFEPLPEAHAFPMLEWGLNWCISTRAHAYLMIHAAVVERGGLAAILPAPPGSGKSTLCAALVNRGWRLLSDELALFRPEDGLLVPVPRPVSLKNRSIDVIRGYVADAVLSRPVTNTTKGTVAHLKAPADSVARAHETARPAWIVFPKYEAGAATSLTPIPRARAFFRVAENAFNYSHMGACGFATLAGAIEGCASYDFRYSNLDEAMALFAALEAPR
ncbi:HprK-related kinase A [Herbaspirillum sp. SJZ107]|uniref:HprK-related kinase A n=1 Tax=Herbaspirillum sp. SJZ107 TaxID=2572881 RepID=UPI00116C2BD6|nr:HprK-related kinase A [Herbaspirillum sp. SJZ107]TQK05224.1 Hpr(Ser) kinase/phosphatase [Herbaspirillum sp. SJZ107]